MVIHHLSAVTDPAANRDWLAPESAADQAAKAGHFGHPRSYKKAHLKHSHHRCRAVHEGGCISRAGATIFMNVAPFHIQRGIRATVVSHDTRPVPLQVGHFTMSHSVSTLMLPSGFRSRGTGTYPMASQSPKHPRSQDGARPSYRSVNSTFMAVPASLVVSRWRSEAAAACLPPGLAHVHSVRFRNRPGSPRGTHTASGMTRTSSPSALHPASRLEHLWFVLSSYHHEVV